MNVTIFWVSIGLGFLAVVLMGVGVWVLVNSVTRPLSAISDAADAIGKGDFSYRVPRGFDKEFDQIAVLFNVMTEKLQIQHLSEDQARLELEYKVSQRTTELMAVNAELAKSDSVRRSFLADISHELRTPLTIIRGEAQVALRHADRDVRDYQDALTCIHEQAISLSHLVDDLLFVARTDSGTMRIDKRNVDLTALADEVIRDMRSLADKNDVSLEASHPVPVSAVIDPDRIKQLFIILVENALSYSGGGSSVKVSVLKQQGKTASIDLLRHALECHLGTQGHLVGLITSQGILTHHVVKHEAHGRIEVVIHTYTGGFCFQVFHILVFDVVITRGQLDNVVPFGGSEHTFTGLIRLHLTS